MTLGAAGKKVQCEKDTFHLLIVNNHLSQRGGGQVALSFHAERLDHPLVWKYLSSFLEMMRRWEIRATFFVYAQRSAAAGVDITERIKAIRDLGHEIGQHTHFYADDVLDGPSKTNDLSPANIHRCLLRDHEFLAACGVIPKGFVSGGWVWTDCIVSDLKRLGFSYDCSELGGPGSPGLLTEDGAELLRIPHLMSVGSWLRGGLSRILLRHDLSYPALIYLHDYDLLRISTRFALHVFVMTHGRRLNRSISEITQHLSKLSH